MDTSTNSASEEGRKLFIGGLAQDAVGSDVREYFSQFGEVENVNLKTDPATGRSRGFAFVLFKDEAGLQAATANESHTIKGKTSQCKKAEAKPGKIFIAKLPAGTEMSNDVISEHFAQFGEVTEVVRPVDKSNNDTPKNFAFVTFAREEVARQLIKTGSTTINGTELEVKRVTQNAGPGGRGGRGGGRGGRGGFAAGGYGGYGDPYAMAYGGYGGYDAYGGYGGGDAYGYGAAAGGYNNYGGGKVRGGGRGRGRTGGPY